MLAFDVSPDNKISKIELRYATTKQILLIIVTIIVP